MPLIFNKPIAPLRLGGIQNNSRRTPRILSTILVVLFLIVMSPRLLANAADDMKQIAKTYAAMNVWSVNISYSVFASFTCLNPQATEQGLYIKSGDSEYLRVAGVETFSTRSMGVMADHDSKTLTLMPPSAKSLNPFNPEMALQMCSKITPVETKDGCRGYYFLLKNDSDGELAGISLLFDPKTWLVKKLCMFYKANVLNDKTLTDEPRMEVSYFNYNTNPGIAADFFNASHFITGYGNSAIPQNEYAGYTVVDNRR